MIKAIFKFFRYHPIIHTCKHTEVVKVIYHIPDSPFYLDLMRTGMKDGEVRKCKCGHEQTFYFHYLVRWTKGSEWYHSGYSELVKANTEDLKWYV